MNEVSVGQLKDASELSSMIDLAGKQFELRYRTAAGPLNLSAEPYLAATLIPAMKLGVPLRVPGSVSPKLLANLAQIQQVLHAFFPELQLIEIVAEPGSNTPNHSAGKVASFFSGGMDSFYTFLKHREEIDALILVHGFDIRLRDQDVWDRVAPSLRAAARELGKPLVEVGTNVQVLTEPYLDWNSTYGSALASVALLLAPLFRKIYIPAGFTYAHLFPFGSHPLLDPLWSTESVEIVHDGCEATRVDKAALLATSDTALKYLRVCYQNRNELREVYNCGKCEKCLRTKICLYLVGALDRCATFDHALDLQAVSRLPIHPPEVRPFVVDNLEAAERLHADPALIQALRDALNGPMPGGELPGLPKEDNATIERLQQENAALATTIQAIHASRSWRVSRPLRALGEAARKMLSWWR